MQQGGQRALIMIMKEIRNRFLNSTTAAQKTVDSLSEA